MSNPAYSPGAHFTPSDLIVRLRTFSNQTDHEFWPDDISLLDESIFVVERIHGSRQVTDLYLLALAARHKGRLATFDAAIPTWQAGYIRSVTAGSTRKEFYGVSVSSCRPPESIEVLLQRAAVASNTSAGSAVPYKRDIGREDVHL